MLEKLLKAIKAKLAELDAAHAKVVELETSETPDTDAVTAAKAVYDKFDGEFKALEAQVDEAKKHAARAKVLDDVTKMAGVVPPVEPTGKVDPAADPAKAKDNAADECELEERFLDYFCGKAISDTARDALRPTSKKILEGEGKDSLRIPKRFLIGMLGANWAKTMYSTARADNTSQAQNVVPPTDFRSQLQMLATPTPTALDYVTIIRSNVGSVTFPRLVQTDANQDFGGMAFRRTTEGAEKPETEPRFDQVEIVPYELAGYTEISHRLLSRSAIDLEALLETLAGSALRFILSGEIINGAGPGAAQQCLGIVNDAGVRTVPRTTGGAVVYRDLVNLKHIVRPHHRGNARYIMEDEVEQGFENTLDGQGRPLFNASVANGPYDRLIGYPYNISLNCPAIGTAGDIIFGNLAWYFLLMEEEVTMARSDHFRFRNNLAAFRMFLVAGGRPMEPRAMAYLEEES